MKLTVIPGTYINLDLDISGSTAAQAGLTTAVLQFNNDSTSGHYTWSAQGLNTDGSTSTGNSNADTSFQACLLGGISNSTGGCHIHVPFYTQTIQHTALASNYFGNSGTPKGGGGVRVGNWTGTAAITEIDLTFGVSTTGFITLHGEN